MNHLSSLEDKTELTTHITNILLENGCSVTKSGVLAIAREIVIMQQGVANEIIRKAEQLNNLVAQSLPRDESKQ